MPERTEEAGREPDAVCDGGDLDCGSGLLLIIRRAMSPIHPGGLLEVRSRESSVREDLPAWCRMVGHALLSMRETEDHTAYRIRKKDEDSALEGDLAAARAFRWKVRAKWTEGLRARVFARNLSFDVGQPASFDTEDAAPSALEYLLGALAGALTVGLRWRASRAGIRIRDLEVSLEAEADDILVFLGLSEEGHPGLRTVRGRIFVAADAAEEDDDPEELLRRMWQETLDGCPLTHSLQRPVSLDLELRLI